MWFTKGAFQPSGKHALIVGASQGLGADIALRLYERNCSVILVARTEAKLQDQVERITRQAGDRVNNRSEKSIEYYVCDVSNYKAVEDMWSHLLDSRKIDPDFIFCCAGLSICKLFGDLTGRELAQGLDVNYSSAVNTIHAGHRALLARKRYPPISSRGARKRHVILFSSTVANYPFIGYAQYAPSKAALVSLATILRQELGPLHYRVTCVFPGNFESEGYAEENKTKPKITKQIEGPSKPISSLECCDIVLDKLAKGYDSIYTDFIGWVLASSTLGVNPRCWSVFQILVSFFFSIIGPLANFVVYRDVVKFFEQRERERNEVGPESENSERALS